MSGEETPEGLVIAEKFFGILAIIVGIFTIYYTYVSMGELTAETSSYPGIFVLIGFIIVAVGVLLVLAKPK